MPLKAADKFIVGCFVSFYCVLRRVPQAADPAVRAEREYRPAIGLNQRCILTYTSEDFEETLTSLGDETSQGDTVYYFGDYTSMSNKYIIPYDCAIEALKIFVTTGRLSENIRWTDKLF